jgi:hypothetical protein
LDRIVGTTTVLAFGNTGAFDADRVRIQFAPGVQGFAFNFADIGDVSDAELRIRWAGGAENRIDINDMQTGFFSLIAEAGRTIDQITLIQRNGSAFNDGFLFSGFTTLTVVPLPPAAWAGLAMLGGVAGVRKLRRR